MVTRGNEIASFLGCEEQAQEFFKNADSAISEEIKNTVDWFKGLF